MSNLTQTTVTVKLAEYEYAQVDLSRNIVTVHMGQRTGADNDWGGQITAALELDRVLAIAEAVVMLRQANESALFLATEDAEIEKWAARLDEQRDAAHCLVSENF